MGAIIDGVFLTPLKIIDTVGGDVLHGMKASDLGFVGFGEAYFSIIEPMAIKAWKRHNQMTLNLIVPQNAIRFVIYDDRKDSVSKGKYDEVVLSRDNYKRLTVPPGVWMGFQGASNAASLLLNVADIVHSPAEVDRRNMDEIGYDW